MKPNRVPADLIEAGFDAIRAWYAAHPSPNTCLDDRTQMRIVLAAALTLRNEQVEQPLRERAEVAEAVLVEHEEAKALLERLRSPEIADYDSQLLARWISKAIGHGMEAAKLRAELAKVRVAHDSAVGAWSAQQDIIQAERRRADAAECTLAEMRERIGTESFQWGVQGAHGTFAVDDEAAARWHTYSPTETMTAVRRVVGEWKAPEQQTEEQA